MSRPEPRELPDVGTVMVDTARDRIGEFRGRVGGSLWFRPLGGGREWEVSPDYAREATDEERLSAGLAARNALSLKGSGR